MVGASELGKHRIFAKEWKWLHVLRAIEHNTFTSTTQAAKHANSSYGSTSIFLRKFERLGWVDLERVSNKGCVRWKKCSITAKGLGILREFRLVGRDYEENV